MRVKILKHNIELETMSIDENKTITVKIFGAICSFNKDEYEVVDDK